MLYFRCDLAGLYNIVSFERCLSNSMSMFICAKLDELKMYVHTEKHTKYYTSVSSSGSDLIINGTDVDREPQRSLSSHCDG